VSKWQHQASAFEFGSIQLHVTQSVQVVDPKNVRRDHRRGSSAPFVDIGGEYKPGLSDQVTVMVLSGLGDLFIDLETERRPVIKLTELAPNGAWHVGIPRSSAFGDAERRSEEHPQRYTSTGIFECVSTLTVSLPRTTAETPRRPCEAITIKSHFLASAASMIA